MPLMASGAHVAPIHLNPYDISGVGSPEGNWFEIWLSMGVMGLAAALLFRIYEVSARLLTRGCLVAVLFATAMMALGVASDPVSSEDRVAGTRAARAQTLALDEKFSTVQESYRVPDGWGWRLSGYSKTVCAICGGMRWKSDLLGSRTLRVVLL